MVPIVNQVDPELDDIFTGNGFEFHVPEIREDVHPHVGLVRVEATFGDWGPSNPFTSKVVAFVVKVGSVGSRQGLMVGGLVYQFVELTIRVGHRAASIIAWFFLKPSRQESLRERQGMYLLLFGSKNWTYQTSL